MPIANYVALNDFGGLQTLYLAYAKEALSRRNSVITINRASDNPIEIFAREIEEHGGTIHSPRLGRLYRFTSIFSNHSYSSKVSNFILQRSIKRVCSSNAVNRIIFWNTLPVPEMIPRNGDCIVYDHGMSSIRKPTRKKVMQLKISRQIVTISRANLRLLEERWACKGRIEILPNPLRHVIAQAPLIKKPQKNNGDSFVIGCAARLVAFKGIATVLHAISHLKSTGLDVELNIAGSGPELEILKLTAKRLDIENRVKFSGIVEDMAQFFSTIDMFVAPSLREPFGLSPLEALASGVPTVMSNVDGHAEMLPFDGAAILLEPSVSLSEYHQMGSSLDKMPEFVYRPKTDTIEKPEALNPSELAEIIEAVMYDYDLWSGIAFQAALQIRKNHSIKKYFHRFNQIMEA